MTGEGWKALLKTRTSIGLSEALGGGVVDGRVLKMQWAVYRGEGGEEREERGGREGEKREGREREARV